MSQDLNNSKSIAQNIKFGLSIMIKHPTVPLKDISSNIDLPMKFGWSVGDKKKP